MYLPERSYLELSETKEMICKLAHGSLYFLITLVTWWIVASFNFLLEKYTEIDLSQIRVNDKCSLDKGNFRNDKCNE